MRRTVATYEPSMFFNVRKNIDRRSEPNCCAQPTLALVLEEARVEVGVRRIEHNQSSFATVAQDNAMVGVIRKEPDDTEVVELHVWIGIA